MHHLVNGSPDAGIKYSDLKILVTNYPVMGNISQRMDSQLYCSENEMTHMQKLNFVFL